MTVLEVYAGSNGEATKALYGRLAAHGPAGMVALNLFRAQKASQRAKVYRGGVPGRGSYKSMAYDKKAWAMSNLCDILEAHASVLGLRWGWQRDSDAPVHQWVLYVDGPTGQVSFHATARLTGPDYPYAWDGAVNASVGRIVRWCEQLLAGAEVRA